MYFNPIAYFIRQFFRFLRSITGKLFVIFVLLFAVLILYMCIDKGVFAISPSGTGQYGNYVGFSAHDVELLDNIITQYKGDYDSFFARYYYSDVAPDRRISISFYNYDTSGRLYATSTGPTFNYLINSEYSVNNSVNYVVFNYYDMSLVSSDLRQNVYLGIRDFGTGSTTSSSNVFYTNRIVYTSNSFVTQFFDGGNNSIASVDPFITNSNSTISNWSFDYLKINSGSVGYVYYDPLLDRSTYSDLYLKYVYDGITYSMPINSSLLTEWSSDNFIVEIPRTSLLTSVNIQNGKTVEFYLEVKQENVGDNIYSLGSYTFSLSTTEQEQIQQDSDKALQGEILQTQQETNNKLDSIENTITDTTVPDDSNFALPTIEVNDTTSNFFDTLFTGIYNAFNTNEDVSISFTIFSKTITINSSDFRMLNDSRFTILRNLLESSWYFAIGYMILKDIRHIFDKIKTGNIENAVSNDIKADMV